MLMAISMKATGKMIWPTEEGVIHMLMELCMMATGSKTSKKAMEWSIGLMALSTRASSKTD